MHKRAYKQIGITFFILIFISTSVFSANLQLVEFNTDNYDDLQSYIKIIEEKGITARHIFPPNTVIFEMYQRTDNVFDNDVSIAQTYSSETIGLNKLNGTNKVHTVFNHLIQSILEPKSNESLPPLYNCESYGTLPDSINKANNITSKALTSTENSLTGQYMIGSIAVGIYLMESTGSGENWWAAAEQTTFNEIVEGLNWLSEEALSRGNRVVWVYAPIEKISTTLEPITGDSKTVGDSAPNWIHDLLYSQGQSQNWDGAYGLANQLRKTYKTDWATEIAVVMDENDADHKFADNRFAYVGHPSSGSQNKGPLVVITFNNNGWGSSNMNVVVSHEVSHIFGASDEYSGCDCGVQSSFLGVANGNCVTCNATPELCLMRSQDAGLCDFSAHQLGWRDSYDSDGASDPIDPNSHKYYYPQPVAPGDLVRIYNTAGQLVNVIAVTNNNVYNSAIFWSGITFQNNIAANGIYSATRNGVSIGNKGLVEYNPPAFSITNHSYSSNNIAISHTSAFNFRHTIYDSLGEVYARPQFDKSIFQSATFNTDITGYTDGIYTSEVFGWLGDGRNTNTSSLQFINYICGDINNSGSDNVDVSDLVYLVDFIFNNGADPVHPLSADLDCIGGFGADISDLIIMVAFVYNNGPAPQCCHSL